MTEQITERPEESEYAPYYHGYISNVPEGNILTILESELDDTLALLAGISEEQAEHRYAPGKWSIKEVVGHMADGERIFGSRAHRISRNDATPLPGFDENAYVAEGNFGAYTLSELAEELALLRRANLSLFRHLSPEAWVRIGVANGRQVSVRAVAFILAGHEMHHKEIIRSRYL